MEEMDYNLLFRWFVGLNADDEVWDATIFTKNRDRLLEGCGRSFWRAWSSNCSIASACVSVRPIHDSARSARWLR